MQSVGFGLLLTALVQLTAPVMIGSGASAPVLALAVGEFFGGVILFLTARLQEM